MNIKNLFKQKKNPPKPPNPEFEKHAALHKTKETYRYLNAIRKFFNDPEAELLRQRGLLLEILYTHKKNTQEKDLLRRDIQKIDSMLEKYNKKDVTDIIKLKLDG